MPRVKPLTEEQATRWRQQDLCKEIMDRVKERKGLYDLDDVDVANRIGISPPTYSKLKKTGVMNSKFSLVLTLVHFSGYELKLVKREDAKPPRKKSVSAKTGDTYGTIIEGLIRQIVQETMEKENF